MTNVPAEETELEFLFCGGPSPFSSVKEIRDYLRHLDGFPDCPDVREQIHRYQKYLREAEAREGRGN
jgi:hypothetical protein